MKLLLISTLVLLCIVIPIKSYAEFNLGGSGFGIVDDVVKPLYVQTSLQVDSDKYVFKDGTFSLDGKTTPITDLNLSISNNKKNIKLDAHTSDFFISASGKIIASINSDSIYYISGTISEERSHPFSSFIVLKQNPVVSKSNSGMSEVKQSTVKQQPHKDLIVMYKQDQQTYWNDNYDVYVKVFDKSVNPNPKYDDFGGLLNNVSVNVDLVASNAKQYLINGTSSYGIWHGTKFFKENISLPGKYNVTINVVYGDSKIAKYETMFLIGTALNRITVTNSTQ